MTDKTEKKYLSTTHIPYQGSFFGVRIRFLASEGGSLHKYTNQSQSLRILQPEKRTLFHTGYRLIQYKWYATVPYCPRKLIPIGWIHPFLTYRPLYWTSPFGNTFLSFKFVKLAIAEEIQTLQTPDCCSGRMDEHTPDRRHPSELTNDRDRSSKVAPDAQEFVIAFPYVCESAGANLRRRRAVQPQTALNHSFYWYLNAHL
jgi:hypothetical protein